MSDTLNLILAVQSAGAVRDLNKAKAATNQVADSINNASNAAKKMGNQFNNTGVRINKFAKGAMQQAGYQVADFAVQVGNGTSVIQSFGQQASQMLAIFGPIGSILGAGVAVFSALAIVAQKSGSSFMGFGASVESLEKVAQELNQSLSDLSKTYKTDVKESVDAAREAFGEFTPELKLVLDQLRELEERKAFSLIEKGIAAFKESDVIRTAAQDMMLYRKANEDTAFAASRIVEQVKNSKIVLEQVRKEYQKQGKDLDDVVLKFQVISGAFDKFSSSSELTKEKILDLTKTLAFVAAFSDGELKTKLLELQKILADTSVQVGRGFQGAGRNGKNGKDGIDKIVDSFKEATKSLQDQNQVLKVRNELFGQSEAVRIREIQLLQLYKEIQASSNKLTKQDIDNRLAAISEQFKQNQLAEQLKDAEKARQEAAKEADKRRREELEWTVNMEKQRAKARDLANKKMLDDQKRINDLMRDGFQTVSNSISGLINKTNSWRDVLNTVLQKVIEIVSKMGATKSGGFSFEKLFSSFAMSFAGGGQTSLGPYGSSTGPMFPGLGDFHTGGIVGGPAQKGLRSDERMIVARTGERVLNRGQAIMADQGGNGGIVINQTINLSTGVQQTVRAEVMSMAPQIAAQAKAAVLDAKRRGGGFSAAFA